MLYAPIKLFYLKQTPIYKHASCSLMKEMDVISALFTGNT